MDFKNNNIIIYQSDDGRSSVNVTLEDETVWLKIDQIATLFKRSRSSINEHILHIYKDNELSEIETKKKIGNSDNSTKPTNYYNLDVIISVGYRVNSVEGTKFRKWATERIKEYIIKGFAIDDNRLKGNGGGNYWKELLERIRDIRSSEKVMYRQVLDLYATSIDYDPKSDVSKLFFKTVQNKLHYATNQQTAAEIIYKRADSEKTNMGLTNFKGELPVKSEVTIAKNYLHEDELFRLNRLVSAFFDLAEIKAQEHKVMTMKDWVEELDKFSLNFGRGVMVGKGKVSHKKAKNKAIKEYKKFQVKSIPSVEKEYLDSIKKLEESIKKKIKE